MVKNYLNIFVIIICISFVSCLLYYKIFCQYYNFGENDTFYVKVDEPFEIKLFENGSTGCINCWLNEKQNKSLKLIRKKYQKSIQTLLGSDGNGGITTFTFKAYKKGIYSIKFANCPIGIEKKECEDYNEKNTMTDNKFIVIANSN